MELRTILDILDIRRGVYAAVVGGVVWAGGAVDAAAVVVEVDEASQLALEHRLVGGRRGRRGVEVGRE